MSSKESANYDRYAEEIDSAISGSEEKLGFGWAWVRILGELQMLTRASYVVLLVVPIIAGLWPAVVIVVNRYNDTIETASEKLEIAAGKLNLISDNAREFNSDLVFQDITRNLVVDITDLQRNITRAALDKPGMPYIWVWAFFSALAAILGHTAYQLAAPQNIKRASERDFINERIDDVLKLGESNLNEANEMRRLVTEARAEYLYSHQSRRGPAVISSGLYVIAIFMVVVVISLQTRSVLVASGLWTIQ